LLDVARRRWSEQVLDALELDAAWLPRLLESPAVSGATPTGVPVAAGAGDQAAGALGVGVDRPGPLSVALGTSGVVFAALPQFAADEQARVHAFCHAVPGGWHAMGVMLSAAGSLRWLRDVAAPGTGFGELTGEAEAWAPGAEGLTFLPYLAGERTPHADPDARGSFTGLSLRHDRGALVRAVLEGVAYGLRDSLDLLRELGVAPGRARVSGGGARSELWLRIIASVLELPLERPAVEEGAAYGAALLGGVAGGVWPDVETAVEACVRVRGEVDPDPEWAAVYADGRARFQALYPALRSHYTS
jgi:xylulokinase